VIFYILLCRWQHWEKEERICGGGRRKVEELAH